MGYPSQNGPLTPQQFIAKWRRAELSERSASQEHFIDLCRLLGQPTPAEVDATGAEYTFEKGVTVTGPASGGSQGRSGYADVWWRGKFAWEYKRKGKYRDLAEAYRQLCQYHEALANPPLLVVCDISRIEIHTKFTNAPSRVYAVALDQLAEPAYLDIVRRVFTDPESFRPEVTSEAITRETAERIGIIAAGLRRRGHEPHAAAHFLMKCMFCLFAEDVGLLPDGLFTRLLNQWRQSPDELAGVLTELFAMMRTGGAFGPERIDYFNGGLFDEAPALPLSDPEIGELLAAASQDWSAVEPSIFGTLFERTLDPSKRAQIGAHYTSREDIMLVVEPVVMAPLRRRWDEVRGEVDAQLARRRKARTDATKRKANARISELLNDFMQELGAVRILDPACGSGNFLYVAIQQVLDLEKDVIAFAARPEVGGAGLFPNVRPTQLAGIEVNPYAAELAQVVIWIGYLQWMRDNGFVPPRDPILEPLQTIECRDAILAWADEDGKPIGAWREGAQCTGPAHWPQADFIIGNPPFLGSKVFREYNLPDAYIEAMYAAYDIPNSSDLCCYWFERARQAVARGTPVSGVRTTGVPPVAQANDGQSAHGQDAHATHGQDARATSGDASPRVGLLATQGIRGGANRQVLKRIKDTGDIFTAWSDRRWILDGAAVHVSIVGFDDGSEAKRTLDGKPVTAINGDLTGDVDTSKAVTLVENAHLPFMGETKQGPFELTWQKAKHLLKQPNPNCRSSFDVVRPWANGRDITQRRRGMWIVDFPEGTSEREAAAYEKVFEHIAADVKPWREKRWKKWFRPEWWIHYAPRPQMKTALAGLQRFIVTPRVAKYRLFSWYTPGAVVDCQLIAFARSDDYFFGVLHSSVHELWALRMGTQLESRPRYTPTTCFETFALPWAPGREPVEQAGDEPVAGGPVEDSHGPARPTGGTPVPRPRGDALHAAISAAAAELNAQRERWLNPPEWLEPIARRVDRREDFSDVPEAARELIRRSAIQAEAAGDEDLKKRTLTNLYNERPTWLQLAHAALDRAVLAAYAAVDPEGGWDPDWADVWQPTGAGRPLPDDHPLAERRAGIERRVLANLLRLNAARALRKAVDNPALRR